jgi:hypothetical protein
MLLHPKLFWPTLPGHMNEPAWPIACAATAALLLCCTCAAKASHSARYMLQQPLSNAFAPLLMPQLQSRGPVACSVHAMGLLKAAHALSRAAAADTSLWMWQAGGQRNSGSSSGGINAQMLSREAQQPCTYTTLDHSATVGIYKTDCRTVCTAQLRCMRL